MNDNESRPLPLWLKVAGTVFVAFHFLVLGAHVLSSRSGPWPSPFGQSPAEGPQFAGAIASAAFPWYLEPLRFTHDYHFNTNRVSLPEVKFEIKLYNKLGQVIDTLEFPEKTANPWVKHRLDLLAQNLAGDVPVEARQAERTLPPFARVELQRHELRAGGQERLRLHPLRFEGLTYRRVPDQQRGQNHRHDPHDRRRPQ